MMAGDRAVERAQAAFERAMGYGGTGSAASSPQAAPESVPTALTNPNLFGGLSVDPSAAATQAQSPWSSYGVEADPESQAPEGYISPFAKYLPGQGLEFAPQETPAGLSVAESLIQRGQQTAQSMAIEEEIDRDITAVQEARFEDVQNYKQLAELAITAYHSEDEQYNQLAQQLLHELKDVEAFRQVFETLDESRSFDDYYEPPSDGSKIKRGLAWVGEKLDATSQWGLNMLADLKREDYSSAASRTGEGVASLLETATGAASELTGLASLDRLASSLGLGDYSKFVVPDYWAERGADRVRDAIPDPADNSALDLSGDGRLSFFEAAGIDPDWGKNYNLGVIGLEGLDVNAIANLAGEMAVDPLSYVTVGAGGAVGRGARHGREILENVAMNFGDDLVKQGALQIDELSRIRYLVANIKSGRPWKQFADDADKDLVRKVLEQNATNRLGEAGAEHLSASQLKHIERTAEALRIRQGGGAFFAGQVPIPGTRSVSQAAQRAGLIGERWTPVGRGGTILDDVADGPITGIKQVSRGSLTSNPAIDKMKHFTDNLFKTFARTTKIHDDARARVVRELASNRSTFVENKKMEWTSALEGTRREAIKEVEKLLGLSGKEASQHFAEEVTRVRSLRGSARASAIEELRTAGRVKLIEAIKVLDRTSIEMRSIVEDLGYDVRKWDALRYAPRNISRETVKLLDEIKREGGELWEGILEASTGEGSYIVKDLVRRGVLTEEDANGPLGSLLGRWTMRPASEIAADAPDELMSLHSLFLGNRSGKTRNFMPDTKNIIDVNKTIADIFHAIGKEKGTPAVITEFYDIDPVDGFIRYMDGFSSEMVAHDLFSDLKRLTVGDIKVGKNRPAVIEGERTSRALRDEAGELTGDYEVTYSWVDPENGIRKSVTDSDDMGLVKQLREMVSNSHYQIKPVGGKKFFLVDSTILEEFESTIIPRLKKSYVEGDVMRLVDKWNGVWAAHATVPLIGSAFHARNSVGNWFLMALAGFKNPKLLADAAHYQAVNKAIQTHMRRSAFHSWDEAADDLIAKPSIKTKVGRIDVNVVADDVKTLRMLRENGAINGSFFSDLKTDRLLFSGADQKHTALSALVDNPVIRSGQAFGATVENNARIALFLDGIDKGLGPAQSARRVRQFLFDYSDLTPFEDQKLRTLSRFYTFLRKNTELQMRMMVSYPGSVWNTQKVIDNLMGSIFGDDGDPRMAGYLLPEFAEDADFMFNAQDSYLHGYETPLVAAVDTLSAVFGSAALIPGAREALPEPIKRNNLQENFASTLTLMASGPSSLANYLYEQATRTDTFTQAPIADGTYGQAIRFVETMLPSVSKSMREFERLGGFDALGIDEDEDLGGGLVSEHQEGRVGLRMMNLLVGMNVYSLSDEQQARALGAMAAMYEDLRRELRAEDLTAPTMTELREAGRIAEVNMLLNAILFSEDEVASLDAALPTSARELVMRELGMSAEMMDDGEKSFEQLAEEAEQFYEIIEYRIGRPLTQQERWQLGFQMPGVPSNPELEALGLNPYRENQFIQTEDTLYNIEKARQWLEAMAPTWGMTPEQAIAANPLLSEAQIYMSDALAVGMSPEEAMRQYISELSRTRRAALFGVDTLEEYDFEKSMSVEDRISLQRRIQEDVMQYMVIASYFGFPMTYDAALHYVNYGADRLLQGERELLGIPTRESIPNREDPRSEVERTGEAQMTWQQMIDAAQSVTRTGGLSPVEIPPSQLAPG